MSKTARQVKLESIAMMLVSGTPLRRLCELFDYTPDGMQKLVAKPEMQKLVREQQTSMAQMAKNAMETLLLNIETSAKNIVAIANTTNHKDSYKANQEILQLHKVMLPPKEENHSQVDHTHTIRIETQQAVQQLNEGLAPLKQLFEGQDTSLEDDPHFMEGKDSVNTVVDAEFMTEPEPDDRSPKEKIADHAASQR